MSDDVLRFEAITVRRMNGLHHGALSVDAFGSGVNIIFGPNASGKTTVAEALQLVLWPDGEMAAQAELEGHFLLDGARWRVDLVHGQPAYQRDGLDADPPRLPSSDKRHAYRLYLHELLRSTNDSFATSIRRAAVGGYNVPAASDALGFKPASTRRRKSTHAVVEARTSLRDVRSKQELLWSEHRRIEALEREAADAQDAAERARLLEHALEYREARSQLADAEHALEAFPDALDAMDGNETERLQSLRSEHTQATQKREEATSGIQDAEMLLAENVLPDDGLSEGFIEGLQHAIHQLEEGERSVRVKRHALEGARREEEEEWGRIEDGVDREKAKTIALPDVAELSQLARDSEKIRGRQQVLEAFRRQFAVEPGEDHDELWQAILYLQRWLSTHAASAPRDRAAPQPRWIVLALMLIGAGSAAWVGWFGHPVGWGLAVAAIVLGLVYGFIHSRKSEPRVNAAYRHDFERLDVPAPKAWTPDEVERHVRMLMQQYADAKVASSKAAEWVRRKDERNQVEERVDALDARRDALTERLGLHATLDERGLSWLVERIGRWQDAVTKVERLKAERDAAARAVEEQLAAISVKLEPFGYAPADDVSTAKALLTRLQAARQEFNEVTQRKEHLEERRDEAEARASHLEAEIEELFTRANLTPDDDAGLARLCEQFPTYEQAASAYREAEVTARNAERRLEQHDDYDASIKELAAATLEHEREALRERARREEALRDQVSRIRQQIDDAKARHDLEEADTAYRQTLETLKRQRTEAYHQTVGWCLAKYVRAQTRERELPPVFRRARELFREITKGRYRLTFDDERAAFAAYDTLKERGHALDELSSGTRVQLLLAVRVAFVEQQERGCKLPIVLDETLANSDDEKAGAIIQAIQQISAQGRQVFYFTAQEDEVAKWYALQKESPIDHRFIALDGAPAPTEMQEQPVMPEIATSRDVPDPSGLTHIEYGAQLGVPGWNPRTPLGALHLWHVIDDVDVLHRFLTLGVKRWGPFQELIGAAGDTFEGLSEEQLRVIRARVRAVEIWGKAWRVGRGKRVDRSVLDASGAVTENYIDEVVALCEAVDGNAATIIEKLRNREVSGFLTRKMDELEAFFLDHGYIDPTPVLRRENMRARVLGALQHELEQGWVDTHDIWQRCWRVANGPNVTAM